MTYEVGQTLIHPQHGPGVIKSLETRTIKGKNVDYVELLLEDDLTVLVPVSSMEEVGVRDVVDKAGLEEILAILSTPTGTQERQWSRRYKAQSEAARSGDPLRIAAVVRDLVRRNEEKNLSLAEKNLLKDASKPLVAEIALAIDADEETSRQIMHRVILEQISDVAVVKKMAHEQEN